MLLRTPLTTDFSVPQQCLAVLQRINPTDTDEASGILSQLLEGMVVASPDPVGHLQVLEEMRPTLDFVLETISKRYASKPLPPASGEEDTFRNVVRMWSLMATNYSFVGQRGSLSPDPTTVLALTEKRGLLAQRRLQYLILAMIEFFRARRELPHNAWRDLHALYLSTERSGVADVRVPDRLNEVWGAQSPRECYVAMLLIDAANPCSRTSREFIWVVRWASRFAPYCSLDGKPEEGEQQVFYGLDMDADRGLQPAALLPQEASLRRLVTTKLAEHIQSVVGQLKKGVAASSLGLGDDCVQPACARLLVSLYRPWGLAAAGRKFKRRRYRGQAQVSTNIAAIAYFLTGTEFEQPSDAPLRTLDFTRTEALLTFGEMVGRNEHTTEEVETRARELGYTKETWDILDQSVTGFRLVRVRGDSHVEHRQIIGIAVSDVEGIILAEVCWLQYQQNGTLTAGVALLPAPPTLVPVKLIVADKSPHERFRIGFLIPAVQAIQVETSLIVPAGWFMADRRVEVSGETPWFARMTKLVSRGTNFDRVRFVREEAPASPEGEP